MYACLGCSLAVLRNTFKLLLFQAAETGCSSSMVATDVGRSWNVWLLQLRCELLFKGWQYYLDHMTGCSDCVLLLTGVINLDTAVDSGYNSVYRCIQSLQCRKLY